MIMNIQFLIKYFIIYLNIIILQANLQKLF
jgi:hypothetical protein